MICPSKIPRKIDRVASMEDIPARSPRQTGTATFDRRVIEFIITSLTTGIRSSSGNEPDPDGPANGRDWAQVRIGDKVRIEDMFVYRIKLVERRFRRFLHTSMRILSPP